MLRRPLFKKPSSKNFKNTERNRVSKNRRGSRSFHDGFLITVVEACRASMTVMSNLENRCGSLSVSTMVFKKQWWKCNVSTTVFLEMVVKAKLFYTKRRELLPSIFHITYPKIIRDSSEHSQYTNIIALSVSDK